MARSRSRFFSVTSSNSWWAALRSISVLPMVTSDTEVFSLLRSNSKTWIACLSRSFCVSCRPKAAWACASWVRMYPTCTLMGPFLASVMASARSRSSILLEFLSAVMSPSRTSWPESSLSPEQGLHPWLIQGSKNDFLSSSGAAAVKLVRFVSCHARGVEWPTLGVWCPALGVWCPALGVEYPTLGVEYPPTRGVECPLGAGYPGLGVE
mmetsp:Transcript_109417/g.309558  ORF Transcript_109417/g.309558 Transcript_109417/m.309558 type:complete len:209 (-) Transcript_109417:155-781(-)